MELKNLALRAFGAIGTIDASGPLFGLSVS